MRLKIQDFDVQIEKLDVQWIYLGVIEGPWKWAAQNSLAHIKKRYQDCDVLNEPNWDALPVCNTSAGPLAGYFYETPDEYKGKLYPAVSGFWAFVQMRSHQGVQEKNLDFTEYNCIVFLEDFNTDTLFTELKKIDWAKVCKDGDIT